MIYTKLIQRFKGQGTNVHRITVLYYTEIPLNSNLLCILHYMV